ncbi:MAG: hypothetical protein CL661_09665 [Bacteroidetes bacterium]|nr:hypothetical protein [Bacteroidota bacterium]
MNKAVFKILLFIIFLQVQTYCFAQGSWEQIEVPTQQFLRSVYFTDSLTGWAVGDSGIIVHTMDGGGNWMIQESNTANDIVDVFFLNSQLGWASSFNYSTPPYGTLLLKTTNGGIDWIGETYPVENIFMTCIFFLDSLVGWMGGIPHALVSTSDGGNLWQQAEVDTSTLAFFPVLDIKFYNEQYGYACGGMFDIAGVTWHTNNGGEKWYAIDASDAPADEVHNLYIFDSLRVIGAGGDPDFGYGVGLIRTFDGGPNWEYEELGMQGIAYDIDFVNDTEAWAPLGPQRKFIYSVDSGSTWLEIPTPESTAIYDITFTDSLHGFAVGSEGAVLKFKPATPVGVENNNEFLKEIILHQNFPNPFKDNTTISFSIINDHYINHPMQLTIFDIYGVKVTSLIPQKIILGKNTITFNVAGFPNGIYYYQLSVGEKIVGTKQLVLMR